MTTNPLNNIDCINNNNYLDNMETPSSSSSSPSSHKLPRTLPKSIEGATYRYKNNYRQQFNGPAEEMVRLSALAHSKILLLRTKAPNFYENRLPKLINQAASALLACNRNTHDGQNKINELHKNFLRVLDELAKSQPAGEVDFQVEKDRAEERDRLLKQHLKLRKRVSELEATEIEYDAIGDDDDADSKYCNFFSEYEAKKMELKRVSLMISKMDGERVGDDIDFHLKVNPRSALSRLDSQQQEQLETQILEMLRENSHKRKVNFVDVKIMEDHINRLGLDKDKFKQTEIRDLIKDALDSYTCYFRELDNQRRNVFHETLLSDPYLKPKEGKILSGPNDLPADVLEKMDYEDRTYQKRIDEVMEKYKNKEELDQNHLNDEGDSVDEKNTRDGDEDEFIEDASQALVDQYFSHKRSMIDRIKEEPRDDYDHEVPIEDERSLPECLAISVENTLHHYKKHKPEEQEVICIDDD